MGILTPFGGKIEISIVGFEHAFCGQFYKLARQFQTRRAQRGGSDDR